jgi:hypothetical protein
MRGSTSSKFYLAYDALISLGLRFCQKMGVAGAGYGKGLGLRGYPAVVEQSI